VREPEAQEALRGFAPELQVVVAFGQILPRPVIDIAPRGTVNVHASLLPRLRGAAPIQWAIANGDTTTGVSTMLIDEGLDTGPVLLQRTLTIEPEETAAELEPRLARLGADVLAETVRGLSDGLLEPRPQDHEKATLAPILRKEDGLIDWARPAREIACRTRGFHPWPGTFTSHGGRTLKVRQARVPADSPDAASDAAPGTVVDVSAEGILVACGSGSHLLLVEVQPESRRPMAAAAFAAGARLVPGDALG
jgi:methionyl-tRNA formyltransferase